MDLPGNYLKNIKEGIKVEVNPQKDKTRKKRITGIVTKILTRTAEHSHGILVELNNGEVGRVKEILNSSVKSLKDKPLEEAECLAINDKDIFSKNSKTRNLDKEPKFDIERTIENPKEENHFIEFKTSSLWSAWLKEEKIQESPSYELKGYGRDASKFIIAKTIASFLNADGGHLIIGVKEDKTVGKNEIIGIDSEFFKLEDPCLDGYRRMIVDQIIKFFFPSEVFHHINDFMEINFREINDKTVCHIMIRPSKNKVFITYNKKGHFFIRIDASSRELHGEDIVDYCMKRFV